MRYNRKEIVAAIVVGLLIGGAIYRWRQPTPTATQIEVPQAAQDTGQNMIVGDLIMTGTSLEAKGIKTITNPKVDTTPPNWFQPAQTKDIEYRLSVLPFTGDRDEDMYLVVPALGLITPIVDVPVDSHEYAQAQQGTPVDMNKYFLNGVSIYPTSAFPGQIGNSVIGGHSNFFKKDQSDYKTIFGTIPTLDPGMEVWAYRKLDNRRNLYRYTVRQSYEVANEDTAVMLPIPGKSEITLYTCTPIGTSDRRWIVKGDLTAQEIF